MSSLLDSLMNNMLSEESTKSLSEKSGATNKQIADVITSAVPVLLQSMVNNSTDEKGAAALTGALSDHAKRSNSSTKLLQNPDTADGEKILQHLLGSNTSQVQTSLAEHSGISASQVQTILSSILPSLMNKVGRETESSATNNSGGIGSILTQLVTGSSQPQQTQSSSNGFDLGGIINFAMKDSDGDGKSDVLSALSGLFGKK